MPDMDTGGKEKIDGKFLGGKGRGIYSRPLFLPQGNIPGNNSGESAIGLAYH
jgi:hypothetical protein